MICLLISCTEKSTEYHQVDIYGKLKSIMHEGAIEARVKTDTLTSENLYALGAIESLRGEITIINGERFMAKSMNDSLVISDLDGAATLLITSHIKDWDTLNIEVNEFDSELEELIRSRNIQTPTTFLITGKIKTLDYHVINFKGEKATRQNHKEGSLNGKVKDIEATVLGYYSRNHQGVFTHHGSNYHMHFVTDDRKHSGHVDSIDFGNSSIKILLPKQ